MSFRLRDAFVESEGLLDLFQALDYVFVTNTVDFVHCVETDADFTQFRSEKILYNLANFFDHTHLVINSCIVAYTQQP